MTIDGTPSFAFWLTEKGTSDKTRAAYLSDLNQYERWFTATYGEDFSPEKLSSHDIRVWREVKLYVEELSPATWNRRKASMAVYCDYCRSIGVLSPSYDPMRTIQTAEAVKLPPRWLDQAEYGRLVRWMEHAEARANTMQRKLHALRDVAMVGLMLYAGLRCGEVVSLRMDDIQISDRKGKVIIRKGKGGKYGEVPLSLDAREAIKPYMETLPEHARTAPHLDAGVEGASTSSAIGKIFPLSTRRVQEIVSEIGRDAQIDDLTSHRLRHTCIKRMLQAGQDPQAVQAIARHAKFSQTAEYARAGWDEMEKAVEGVAIGKGRK